MNQNAMYEELPIEFKEMVDVWPYPHVPQAKVRDFTCGMYSGYSMANYVSRGSGPRKYFIGRNACYNPIELAYWIYERTPEKKAQKKKDENEGDVIAVNCNTCGKLLDYWVEEDSRVLRIHAKRCPECKEHKVDLAYVGVYDVKVYPEDEMEVS